jgi:hypothetical protein
VHCICEQTRLNATKDAGTLPAAVLITIAVPLVFELPIDVSSELRLAVIKAFPPPPPDGGGVTLLSEDLEQAANKLPAQMATVAWLIS